MQVGEVAAATARHEYFLADFIGAFEHDDTPAALARHKGAHEAGCAAAQYDYIEIFHGGNIMRPCCIS